MEQRGHRFEEKIKVINRFTEPLIYATAYPGFSIGCQPQMGVPTYYSAKSAENYMKVGPGVASKFLLCRSTTATCEW